VEVAFHLHQAGSIAVRRQALGFTSAGERRRCAPLGEWIRPHSAGASCRSGATRRRCTTPRVPPALRPTDSIAIMGGRAARPFSRMNSLPPRTWPLR